MYFAHKLVPAIATVGHLSMKLPDFWEQDLEFCPSGFHYLQR
jgi:hypothetical protein